MWLDRFLSIESRRQRLFKQVSKSPLRDFLNETFANPKQDVQDCRFISIDLETSGLNPEQDHILSIGFVEIHHQSIDLSTAQHWIIKSDQTLNEDNVVIHTLTDDVVAQGISLAEAMSQLLPILRGKVLLAHHAQVEQGFLSTACQRLYGGALLMPIVDTLAIAKRRLTRQRDVIPEGSLRLAALREHYHLPRYKAHHALNDAIATAELFLAQIAEKRGSQQELALKNVLTKN